MKKSIYKISFLFVLLLLMSFAAVEIYDNILNDDDFSLEKTDPDDWAISIPKDDFYSYNVWNCFPSSLINIKTSRVDYDGWYNVPSIDIDSSNKHLSYDLDPDVRWDVQRVLDEWEFLLADVETFCIFGAFLQNIEGDNSELWYIEQIKSAKGYWKREELEDYLDPKFKEYNSKHLY